MDFKKCKLCRQSFFSYGSNLCPACHEQTEQDFIIVRDYLYDHPDRASVEEIVEATGVGKKIIIYLMEEERLIAKGSLSPANELRCRICGCPINSGNICESCKASLVKDLGQAATTLENKSSGTAPRDNAFGHYDASLISEYGKKNKK